MTSASEDMDDKPAKTSSINSISVLDMSNGLQKRDIGKLCQDGFGNDDCDILERTKNNQEDKPQRASKRKKRKQGTVTTSPGKQSSITSFFTKAGVRAEDQATSSEERKIVHETNADSSSSKTENAKFRDHSKGLDQLLQILGTDLSEAQALVLLEKAKGDVSRAVEFYYSSTPKSSELTGRDICCSNPCMPDVRPLIYDGKGKSDCQNCQSSKLSIKNVSKSTELVERIHFIALPLEKYDPVKHACWNAGQPAPYLHLARTFESVERERGKLKTTVMLCNMFRSILALSPEDVLPAMYLCTNRIAPDHENIDLNIGEGTVSAAITDAFGLEKAKLKELYNTMGDLGDVAQTGRQTQTLLTEPQKLSIQKVFTILCQISKEGGADSYKRKKSLIVNLLRDCREKEAKFIVRTLVRNMRIGAMMRTLLSALLQASILNSSVVSKKESFPETLKVTLQKASLAAMEAYNILPNLNILVPTIVSKGMDFLSTPISILPGTPIKPMLAKITNGVPEVFKQLNGKAFTCEYKYDGQRAQIHLLEDRTVQIFSRNCEDSSARFPDVIDIILSSINPNIGSFVLDAEVVAVDRVNGNRILAFQHLASRERGRNGSFMQPENIKVQVCLFIFDLMFLNGQELLALPLRERQKKLKELFPTPRPGYLELARNLIIECVEANPTSTLTVNRVKDFMTEAVSSSCEGIMVKTLDDSSQYAPSKRSDSWLKVKQDYIEGLNDTLDLVPIGAWYGNGRKAGWYSPFLLACYNLESEEYESVCRVMSGFSDIFYKEMKEFFSEEKILSKKPPYYRTLEEPDVWFTPELVWEIRGADLTISPVHQAAMGLIHQSRGISLRFPRFIRQRDEKNPEDSTSHIEIADLFHHQTRKADVGDDDKH